LAIPKEEMAKTDASASAFIETFMFSSRKVFGFFGWLLLP
jgi:hypothetical protein